MPCLPAEKGFFTRRSVTQIKLMAPCSAAHGEGGPNAAQVLMLTHPILSPRWLELPNAVYLAVQSLKLLNMAAGDAEGCAPGRTHAVNAHVM